MMTYEEAKMQIQAIPEKIWDQLSEPDREAMEMAFSALQAQELANNSPKLDSGNGEHIATNLDCTGCKYEFRADYCCQYCIRIYKDRYEKRDDREES